MRRRTLIAATAALSALARPTLAQNPTRVLRFVPEGNLHNPDPVWTTTTVARNHGLMIWDMLFALDESFTPRPQMVEAHEVSEDRLTWRFRLREGQVFHDGVPVRGADCIASVQRWGRRRPMGQTLLERTEEMSAPDDRSFVIRLKQPFGLMLEAFSDFCFMMPERVARTDAFTQINESSAPAPTGLCGTSGSPGPRPSTFGMRITDPALSRQASLPAARWRISTAWNGGSCRTPRRPSQPSATMRWIGCSSPRSTCCR